MRTRVGQSEHGLAFHMKNENTSDVLSKLDAPLRQNRCHDAVSYSPSASGSSTASKSASDSALTMPSRIVVASCSP